MSTVIQVIQAGWLLLKLVVYVISLIKQPEDAAKIARKATKEVKAVKLAANPKTPITTREVSETLDSHMEDIDEIIQGADFQRIKRGL